MSRTISPCGVLHGKKTLGEAGERLRVQNGRRTAACARECVSPHMKHPVNTLASLRWSPEKGSEEEA
jgi:hypothetical protein